MARMTMVNDSYDNHRQGNQIIQVAPHTPAKADWGGHSPVVTLLERLSSIAKANLPAASDQVPSRAPPKHRPIDIHQKSCRWSAKIAVPLVIVRALQGSAHLGTP